MANKVTEWRGVRNLVYAKVIQDDADDYKTGEVKTLAGLAKVSKTVEQSTESHYYDDVAAININSTGADEVTLEVSAIGIETLADVTGQKFDPETGAMLEGERSNDYFAIGYIASKEDGTDVYVWRYKGTFSIPDSNHDTKTDGTEANGDEITFTGVSTAHVFNKWGTRGKALVVDTGLGKADVSNFFKEVTTPDTLKAVE